MKHGSNTDKKKKVADTRLPTVFLSYPCSIRVSSVTKSFFSEVVSSWSFIHAICTAPRVLGRHRCRGCALAAGSVGAAAEQTSPPARFRLGIVTYNIAAAWDVPTILRVCRAVGLAAVELRTTHKHGVEPSMSAQARREVRQRFADAGVEIWGCGTVCEFHSTDQAVVNRNIETCRRFVQLVADIGGKGVKVRPNGLPADVPVAARWRRSAKRWAPVGRPPPMRASKFGSKCTAAAPSIRRTSPPSCAPPTIRASASPGTPTPPMSSMVGRRVFPAAAALDQVVPHQRTDQRLPLPRAVPPLPRNRLRPRHARRDPGHAGRAAGERLMRYYKGLWSELVA